MTRVHGKRSQPADSRPNKAVWAARQRSRKAGQPPGTLVHIGEKTKEETRLSIMKYNAETVEERETANVRELPDPSPNLWINVDGMSDLNTIEAIGQKFGIHPLTLEDIVNTTQRPKMEDYGDYVFVVIKMLHYDEAVNEVSSEQISLILGPNFLLSFQEDETDDLKSVKERIRSGKGRIRMRGVDYLAYCLIDAVVDNYFVMLEKLADKIEFLEDEFVTNPKAGTLSLLHKLKTNMVFLRRSVWPMREVINRLAGGESPLVNSSTIPYLRDVYDHTIHAIDMMETYRDIISGMLDIYLSSVTYRLNEIMKVLTIIATIFIPLTFLSGWYGMNFKDMPELTWRYGYPMAIGIALAMVTAMLTYFKCKKWI